RWSTWPGGGSGCCAGWGRSPGGSAPRRSPPYPSAAGRWQRWRGRTRSSPCSRPTSPAAAPPRPVGDDVGGLAVHADGFVMKPPSRRAFHCSRGKVISAGSGPGAPRFPLALPARRRVSWGRVSPSAGSRAMRRIVWLLAVVLLVVASLGSDSPKGYDGATEESI